jgi:hypothetical protein
MIGFFESNFLSPQEQYNLQFNALDEQLKKLGFSASMTTEEYTALVKSVTEAGGVSAETAIELLKLGPALLNIKNSAEQLKNIANQNLLSLAENFAPEEVTGIKRSMANDALSQFGLSVDMGKEAITQALREFVSAGGVLTEEMMSAASVTASYFNSVGTVDDNQSRLNAAASSFALLQRSVEAERSRITSDYNLQLKAANDRINAVTESINKLKSISSALSNTVDQISPMNIEAARGQLIGALEQLKSGLIPDAGTLQNALNAASNQSTAGFGSRLDFLRSQGQNLALVNSLSTAAGGRLTAEEQQLNALEAARDAITSGFNSEMQRLDDILSNAKMQLDAINGINTSILSLAEAIRAFNRDASAAGAPNVTGSGVTDQQIKDYFKVARTPDEIAKDAARFGLSSERIAAAAGFSQEQVDQFFRDNPQLPRFASGTSFVPKTGAALVHKGERIINPQQNQDLVSTLKEVLSAVQISTVAQNKISRMFAKWDGDGMPAERTV